MDQSPAAPPLVVNFELIEAVDAVKRLWFAFENRGVRALVILEAPALYAAIDDLAQAARPARTAPPFAAISSNGSKEDWELYFNNYGGKPL